MRWLTDLTVLLWVVVVAVGLLLRVYFNAVVPRANAMMETSRSAE